MTNQSSNQHVDVIIAGGGVTGLSLALMLIKNTALRVALIEAGAEFDDSEINNRRDTGEFLELRSIALSAQSCDLLAQIGVADVDEFGCAIKHIHVSDKGHLGRTTLHAQDYQLGALGHVVELPILVQRLKQQLASYENQIQVFYEDEIVSLSRTQDRVSTELKRGDKLTARLLAVAEGGNSSTREKLGIGVSVEDYQQTALVANIELGQPHFNWAYERFTEQGPLALLPLPSENGLHRSSLVWTLSHAHFEHVIESAEDDFMTALQDEFGYRLGHLKSVGKRWGFPLQLTVAQQHIHHRTALLGNASQTLHPIAGQGLNLALRDVQTLAEIIQSEYHAGNDDIGQFQMLHQYQQARKSDQQTLTLATDTLVRTFSNSHLPLLIARNIALSALDQFPVLKQSFALSAMGYASSTRTMNAKY